MERAAGLVHDDKPKAKLDAARDLSVQTCPGTGRGLWHVAARAATRAHARIAETLESQFAEIADSQPELLARHYTEAGQIEKAAGLWGKAGQRSLERSALVEAVAQSHALSTRSRPCPLRPRCVAKRSTFRSRSNPLMHVKGYAAPETKAPLERARLLIEQAEALGEPPEDPLLLFSVLYGIWVANFVAFNGDVVRELAAQFLALAEKQGATVPLMMGHRLMGTSLCFTGDMVESRHTSIRRSRFTIPPSIVAGDTIWPQTCGCHFSFRSLALWMLGFIEARSLTPTARSRMRGISAKLPL